jgi:hypothetical protein
MFWYQVNDQNADSGGMMATASEDKGPLTPPKKLEPAWQEKITRAKQAREAGKAMRTGKPPVFATNWSLPRVSQ